MVRQGTCEEPCQYRHGNSQNRKTAVDSTDHLFPQRFVLFEENFNRKSSVVLCHILLLIDWPFGLATSSNLHFPNWWGILTDVRTYFERGGGNILYLRA